MFSMDSFELVAFVTSYNLAMEWNEIFTCKIYNFQNKTDIDKLREMQFLKLQPTHNALSYYIKRFDYLTLVCVIGMSNHSY